MDKEICTIYIGNGFLDDDYTFYEDGRIKRLFDQNQFRLNIEQWIQASDIIEQKKIKLLEKCNQEYLEAVKKILSGN